MNEVDEAVALVIEALSNELCRLGARIDQVEAARRDLLTPVANIPTVEGLADHE